MYGEQEDARSDLSYLTEISEREARRRARALIRSTQRGVSGTANRINARTQATAEAFRRAEAEAKKQVPSRGRPGAIDNRSRPVRVTPEVANLDFESTLSALKARVAESRDETRYDRSNVSGGGSGAGGKASRGKADNMLEFGVGREGKVDVGSWAYFKFVLDELIETRVVLRAVSGNSDLYVSTATMKPGPQDFTWRSCRNGTDFVVIRPEDPAAIEGAYYVGVYGERGATSKSPQVIFYVSVTKSKEVTASRRISTAERLLVKQGCVLDLCWLVLTAPASPRLTTPIPPCRYKEDPEGRIKLRDRVAATRWRRRQARKQQGDCIRRNKHSARDTPLRERPGKARLRLNTARAQTTGARITWGMGGGSFTPLGRSSTTSFGLPSRAGTASGVLRTPSMSDLDGGFSGSRSHLDQDSMPRMARASSEPIFKVMDSRVMPAMYSGTAHEDRAKFGEAAKDVPGAEEPVRPTGQEQWRQLFGMFEPTGSDMAAELAKYARM